MWLNRLNMSQDVSRFCSDLVANSHDKSLLVLMHSDMLHVVLAEMSVMDDGAYCTELHQSIKARRATRSAWRLQKQHSGRATLPCLVARRMTRKRSCHGMSAVLSGAVVVCLGVARTRCHRRMLRGTAISTKVCRLWCVCLSNNLRRSCLGRLQTLGSKTSEKDRR